MHFPRNMRQPALATFCFAILFLLVPFVAILLDPSRVFVERDLLRTFLPSKFFWLSTVRAEGVVPAWNPFLYNGTPYWADLKSGALNPFNLVLLFFSPEKITYAFSWFIFCHFPVMAYGMFRFLRSLALEAEAAAVFALVFSLSGVVISCITMPNLLAGQVVLPYFAWLWLERFSRPYSLLSANSLGLMACLAVPLYCATPEFTYFFVLTLGWGWLRKPSVSMFVSLVWIGAGSFLLAAAQLFPAIETLLASKRLAGEFSPEEVGSFNFDPQRIREIFLSLPFGNYGPKAIAWGDRYAATFLYSPYVGAGLPIALVAFFRSYLGQKRPLLLLCMVLFGAGLLVLSFGSYFPVDLYEFFFRHFPGWKLFRYPEKMLIPLSFFLIVAQALGWQRLLGEGRRENDRDLWWGAGAFLVVAIALFGSVAAFPTEEQREMGFRSVRQFYLCGGLMVGLLVLLRARPELWRFRWVLLLFVIGIDLGSQARALTWDQPVAAIQSMSADKINANLLVRAPEVERGGAFRFSSLAVLSNRRFLLDVPGQNLDMVGQMAQSVAHHLVPSYTMLKGIHDIDGSGVLYNAERMKLWKDLTRSQPHRLLNLLGAYYVAQFEDGDPGRMRVMLNQTALPYVFVPERVLRKASREEVRLGLEEEDFAEARELFVESPSPGRSENFRGASVQILDRRSGLVKIRVAGGSGGEARVVALGESHDRHWAATVSGKSTEVLLANGWNLAVNLPQPCDPDCVIEFRYSNPWIFTGLLTTILFMLLLAVMAWIGKRGRT